MSTIFWPIVLHFLGIDHERLTYKFKGRYYLTDVPGNLVKPVLV